VSIFTPVCEKVGNSGPRVLRLLLVDDDEVDRMRVKRMLGQMAEWQFEIDIASGVATGIAAIKAKTFDCVLLDFRLPDGEGFDLLKSVHAVDGDCPPILLQTVLDDESTAVAALALGAQDFLVKGKYDAGVLRRSIRYAIQRDQLVKERNRLTYDLQEALVKVKTLQGLLETCAWCNRIENEEGQWQRVEVYIQNHSDARITHGMCPDCLKKHGGDFGISVS